MCSSMRCSASCGENSWISRRHFSSIVRRTIPAPQRENNVIANTNAQDKKYATIAIAIGWSACIPFFDPQAFTHARAPGISLQSPFLLCFHDPPRVLLGQLPDFAEQLLGDLQGVARIEREIGVDRTIAQVRAQLGMRQIDLQMHVAVATGLDADPTRFLCLAHPHTRPTWRAHHEQPAYATQTPP